MKYEKIIKGKFIDRPNRFIAHVEIEGKTETVHVKNTGRCRELLVPGCTVILEDFRNRPGFENRKTKFDIIAVYKQLEPDNPINTGTNSVLINMDSQAPNKVVLEWLSSLSLSSGSLSLSPSSDSSVPLFSLIKPEYTWGNSRFDFYMEKNSLSLSPSSGSLSLSPSSEKYLLEVKGCTLEKDGTGYFPDAPTERGVKHLKELTSACSQGYKCGIAFVIQIPGVKKVLPNLKTHPEFGQALKEAQQAGVKILYLTCQVQESELKIANSDDGDRDNELWHSDDGDRDKY